MSRIVVINHLTLDGVMQAPASPDEDPRAALAWARKAAGATTLPIEVRPFR